MLQRVKSRFRSSVSVRIMFIYAVVLFALFGISSTAGALDFKIYVNIHLTGETIELEVNEKYSIRDVKFLIQDNKGIPRNKQHLFHGGRELVKDGMSLYSYGIHKGSKLDLYTVADSYPPAPEPTTEPVYEEPVFYALPEDEIGAYAIRDDGTKEYLLFHTYDICMSWLASDELCSGFERCFHKDGK